MCKIKILSTIIASITMSVISFTSMSVFESKSVNLTMLSSKNPTSTSNEAQAFSQADFNELLNKNFSLIEEESTSSVDSESAETTETDLVVTMKGNDTPAAVYTNSSFADTINSLLRDITVLNTVNKPLAFNTDYKLLVNNFLMEQGYTDNLSIDTSNERDITLNISVVSASDIDKILLTEQRTLKIIDNNFATSNALSELSVDSNISQSDLNNKLLSGIKVFNKSNRDITNYFNFSVDTKVNLSSFSRSQEVDIKVVSKIDPTKINTIKRSVIVKEIVKPKPNTSTTTKPNSSTTKPNN